MKYCLFCLVLFIFSFPSFSQKPNFSFELGAAHNKNSNFAIAGTLTKQLRINDNFEVSIGLGMIQSPISKTWYQTLNSIRYVYSFDEKTYSFFLQSGCMYSRPLKFTDDEWSWFIEPHIAFNSFAIPYLAIDKSDAKTLKTVATFNERNDKYFQPFWGIKAGLLYSWDDNVRLSFSYRFTNLDMYDNQRAIQIDGKSLNEYVPSRNFHFLSIGIFIDNK
jgi:hypothetical protein